MGKLVVLLSPLVCLGIIAGSYWVEARPQERLPIPSASLPLQQDTSNAVQLIQQSLTSNLDIKLDDKGANVFGVKPTKKRKKVLVKKRRKVKRKKPTPQSNMETLLDIVVPLNDPQPQKPLLFGPELLQDTLDKLYLIKELIKNKEILNQQNANLSEIVQGPPDFKEDEPTLLHDEQNEDTNDKSPAELADITNNFDLQPEETQQNFEEQVLLSSDKVKNSQENKEHVFETEKQSELDPYYSESQEKEINKETFLSSALKGSQESDLETEQINNVQYAPISSILSASKEFVNSAASLVDFNSETLQEAESEELSTEMQSGAEGEKNSETSLSHEHENSETNVQDLTSQFEEHEKSEFIASTDTSSKTKSSEVHYAPMSASLSASKELIANGSELKVSVESENTFDADFTSQVVQPNSESEVSVSIETNNEEQVNEAQYAPSTSSLSKSKEYISSEESIFNLENAETLEDLIPEKQSEDNTMQTETDNIFETIKSKESGDNGVFVEDLPPQILDSDTSVSHENQYSMLDENESEINFSFSLSKEKEISAESYIDSTSINTVNNSPSKLSSKEEENNASLKSEETLHLSESKELLTSAESILNSFSQSLEDSISELFSFETQNESEISDLVANNEIVISAALQILQDSKPASTNKETDFEEEQESHLISDINGNKEFSNSAGILLDPELHNTKSESESKETSVDIQNSFNIISDIAASKEFLNSDMSFELSSQQLLDTLSESKSEEQIVSSELVSTSISENEESTEILSGETSHLNNASQILHETALNHTSNEQNMEAVNFLEENVPIKPNNELDSTEYQVFGEEENKSEFEVVQDSTIISKSEEQSFLVQEENENNSFSLNLETQSSASASKDLVIQTLQDNKLQSLLQNSKDATYEVNSYPSLSTSKELENFENTDQSEELYEVTKENEPMTISEVHKEEDKSNALPTSVEFSDTKNSEEIIELNSLQNNNEVSVLESTQLEEINSVLSHDKSDFILNEEIVPIQSKEQEDLNKNSSEFDLYVDSNFIAEETHSIETLGKESLEINEASDTINNGANESLNIIVGHNDNTANADSQQFDLHVDSKFVQELNESDKSEDALSFVETNDNILGSQSAIDSLLQIYSEETVNGVSKEDTQTHLDISKQSAQIDKETDSVEISQLNEEKPANSVLHGLISKENLSNNKDELQGEPLDNISKTSDDMTYEYYYDYTYEDASNDESSGEHHNNMQSNMAEDSSKSKEPEIESNVNSINNNEVNPNKETNVSNNIPDNSSESKSEENDSDSYTYEYYYEYTYEDSDVSNSEKPADTLLNVSNNKENSISEIKEDLINVNNEEIANTNDNDLPLQDESKEDASYEYYYSYEYEDSSSKESSKIENLGIEDTVDKNDESIVPTKDEITQISGIQQESYSEIVENQIIPDQTSVGDHTSSKIDTPALHDDMKSKETEVDNSNKASNNENVNNNINHIVETENDFDFEEISLGDKGDYSDYVSEEIDYMNYVNNMPIMPLSPNANKSLANDAIEVQPLKDTIDENVGSIGIAEKKEFDNIDRVPLHQLSNKDENIDRIVFQDDDY